jgi:serine-type D-Ala-D-Ala carboxypeptidase/endopeptidase (penicillin-binding protein 4)
MRHQYLPGIRGTHSLLLILFGVFALLSQGCGSSTPSPRAAETDQPHAKALPEVNGTKPFVPASQDEARLAQAIDKLIDDGELSSARWGVSIVSLRDGHKVYARNDERLFTPASNMKLFPTGVGLELLGADYRWRTSVYSASSPDASGTLNGDLVLYGRGAPDLVAGASANDNNSLARLANDLYDRGLRRIKGNVVGDESYFRGETTGDGWQWNDVQWYFGAEASALSVNNNEVSLNILPPEKAGEFPVVRVNDLNGYLTIENKMVVVAAAEKMTVGIHRGLSDNLVRVWGTFPSGSKGFGARLSVYKPSLWAARILLEMLRIRGVTVEGGADWRDSRQPAAERFDPSRSVELAFVSSRPLSEIIKDTNKYSINLYAELILRTLGRERGALLPAVVTGGRERGDDETGLSVIKLWLDRSGVSTTGLALHDGSGLSRLNLVTPRSLSELLAAISKSPAGPLFRESLPLSGRDGTLGHRLKDFPEQIAAKTGYLTYDTSLSGYVTTPENSAFAFSVICNDDTGRASSGRLIDQIVSLLATYPAATGQKAP